MSFKRAHSMRVIFHIVVVCGALGACSLFKNKQRQDATAASASEHDDYCVTPPKKLGDPCVLKSADACLKMLAAPGQSPEAKAQFAEIGTERFCGCLMDYQAKASKLHLMELTFACLCKYKPKATICQQTKP